METSKFLFPAHQNLCRRSVITPYTPFVSSCLWKWLCFSSEDNALSSHSLISVWLPQRALSDACLVGLTFCLTLLLFLYASLLSHSIMFLSFVLLQLPFASAFVIYVAWLHRECSGSSWVLSQSACICLCQCEYMHIIWSTYTKLLIGLHLYLRTHSLACHRLLSSESLMTPQTAHARTLRKLCVNPYFSIVNLLQTYIQPQTKTQLACAMPAQLWASC